MCLVFLLIPADSFAAKVKLCTESSGYFAVGEGETWSYIKLDGRIKTFEDERFVESNGHPLQILLNRKSRQERGKDDLAVLGDHVSSEARYYARALDADLDVQMAQFDLPRGRKGVVWYFAIPEKVRRDSSETSAVKQVFASVVLSEFILSLASSQFKNQTLEEVRKNLTGLIKTGKLHRGRLDLESLCKKR